MNATRIAILAILVSALAAGLGLYYLQVYYYYERIPVESADVQLTRADTGLPEVVMIENYKGIDATSSPIRYRACFDLGRPVAELAEIYAPYEAAEPLVAPGWFDCFDAEEVGDALTEGRAVAFLGVENIRYGIDRVVAVFPDGRARSWHQINACGEVVFDGNPAPEGCPPPPESMQ
ncbi:DUF6446 family protein [Roseisalinus antarcticus]|uniref:Histidine kinase n=1 Tax=Roseisalinus antarcticus TaxID=254357 RepID=A0A1Y5TL50_9RHOB|nr:DUF6446 family protein [Roseisalinus antarcticus]SLN66540.1 hypothetical protein ROA7023_03160 [Roseisalinus antarcticus]